MEAEKIGNILLVIGLIILFLLFLKAINVIPGTPGEIYTIGTGTGLVFILWAFYYKLKSFIQGEMKDLTKELDPFKHKVTEIDTRCKERTPIYEKHLSGKK